MLDVAVKNTVHGVATESMGARIRRLRLESKLTQQQLADTLGITKSAVSQWELDQTESIKLPTFLRLCHILGREPHYVVFGSGRASDPLRRKIG